MAGKVYKIAFELAAKLEGSYTSSMTKALADMAEIEMKARELNTISISGAMVEPLRDGVKHLEREIKDLASLRVTGDVFKPLVDGAKDLIKELKDLDRVTVSAALLRPIKQGLTEIESRVHAINALRLNPDMARPLRAALIDLNREFRDIRGTSPVSGIFSPLILELKDSVKESKMLLDNLRLISAIRMPGNMFGNDMRTYLRDVEQLERRMRDLQNAGGPRGGGGGGGGGGEGAGNLGGSAMLGGAAVVGGLAVAAGAAAGLAGAAVYSFADEYQVAMAQIEAATGASETEMKDFSNVAQNIYNQAIGENFYDIADSMSRVEQVTQQSGAALESTTKNAIAFRDTFGEDVTESVKAADTMMKNFGVTSDQAYNLLAQGAQNGLNKSNELLDSANEYAPHFATLGFSAADMFDTFGAGLEAGAFNLDKVGDAVKEFNIRSKDMSKTSVEAYQSLGMNAEKMSATFAAGGPAAQKAFQTVAAAISAVEDPVKKNAIGVGLFGTQFEDLEAGVIKAMGTAKNQFDMTKDSMGEITKVKYDTIGKAFQGIGRQVQTGLLLPLSKAALPLLEKFSGFLTAAMPKMKAAFAKISAAFDPAVEKISSMVSGIWENFSGGDGASGIGSYIEALTGLWTTYRDNVLKIWDTIQPHVMGVMRSIGKIIKQIFPIVVSIARVFVQVGTKIVSAIMPIVGYINSKLWPILSKIFGFLADEVMPAISGVIAAILPKIMMVGNKIAEMVTGIFNTVKPVLDALFAAFNFVFPIIKSIVSNAITAIGGVLSGLFDVLGGIIDFVTGVFTGNWSKAWEGVKGIFEGIFNTLGPILAFPINLAIDAINAAIRGINKVSIDVPDWVPGVGGETFGVSIPEIPKIGGYADGGYVTQPELAWVGEGKSNEWIIPENNSQRSKDLWQSAGSSMGLTSQGGGDSFTFAPVVNVYGGDKNVSDQVEVAIAQEKVNMERWFKDMLAQQRRVSLG
jgi:phage-related minor tail protein